MNEIFKTIEIRGVTIEVSNLGNVLKNEVKAKINTNHDGYKVVSINNRNIGVHRLVALAFISNEEPLIKKEVNHIDFDRTNNRVENLEWLSHAENIKHSADNGRYIPKFGKDNPNFGNDTLSKKYKESPQLALEKQSRKGAINGTATPIELYKDGILIRKFEYIGECCEFLHINYGFSSNKESIRSSIRRSISKNIPYKGFTFKKMTA